MTPEPSPASMAMVQQKYCKLCDRHRPSETFRSYYDRRRKAPGPRLFSRCRDCERAIERIRGYRGGKTKTVYVPGIKAAARAKVKYELKMGRMTRQPCEMCGVIKAEAHHDDHTKPLEVRWLCVLHHKMFHWKPTDSPLAVVAYQLRARADALATEKETS